MYIMSLCYRLITKVQIVRYFVLREDSMTGDTVLAYRCDLWQIGGWGVGGRVDGGLQIVHSS
jgi:hypothetical protein